MRGSDRVDRFSLANRGNIMENKLNKTDSSESKTSEQEKAEKAETSNNSTGTVRVNSLEEVEAMTSDEIQRARLSGVSKLKVKKLVEEGKTFLEAKKIIIKENFLRNACTMKDLRLNPVATKRLLSESSTLSIKHHKIAKLDQEVATVEKIAVVHYGFPEVQLEQEKLDILQSCIIAAYEKVPSHGPKVQLVEIISRPGYLEVICADEISAHWLKFTVPTLQPWEGGILTTLDGDNIPKWIACSIYVPDENGLRLEPEKILKRLKVCNYNLCTGLWRAYGTIPKDKGQVWVFMVDEKSREEIEKLNMRPFFGLGKIFFRLMDLEPKEWEYKISENTADAKKADSEDAARADSEDAARSDSEDAARSGSEEAKKAVENPATPI